MNSFLIGSFTRTHKQNRIGFVVMYSLTFFFTNFGPNATTFVVPAEIFLARLRSTCHGILAASGKLGAMVGAFGFLYLAQNKDKAKADAGYPAEELCDFSPKVEVYIDGIQVGTAQNQQKKMAQKLA